MKVDMSKEAVTQRMLELDQLWELAVALRSSDLKNSIPVEAQSIEAEDRSAAG